MSVDLVPDDLWGRVVPLLPPRPPRRRRYPGRLPADDRAALRGVVYVLCKGVSWVDVPAERVGCSGVTAWRRLRDWAKAGVWPRLHEVLLSELRAAGLLDMEDAAVDGSHVRALKRGARTGLSPVDRARPGSKHHLITDRHGTPLAISLTGGNRHDVTRLMPLLDAIPRMCGVRGRPRHRPGRPFADHGYDYDKYRRLLRARGITPKIARKGTPHGSGPGKTRWAVERTFARLHQFKRPRIRYEIRTDLHLRLLQLACSVICLRRLRTSF
ncbi:IS5 family transposase [Streptomyces sp. GS7]|nr:IS5 family transposase [Streptomyces sp. GS7]QHC23681.1 IS5 family transposase [Streptomyces sp. GS7]